MLNRKKGDEAEMAAETYLCTQGLKKVTRNFLCKAGEIDLIMQDQDCLVFIEVRLRNHSMFGSGADSVLPHKQKRIIKASHAYLQKHFDEPPYCRFDVISMSGTPNNYQIDWISDAFQSF